MPRQDGWSALFSSAFRQSRNAMVLVDGRREIVDVNDATLRILDRARDAVLRRPVWRFVDHGPQATAQEWAAAMATAHFTGTTDIVRADGSTVAVQWGASTEVVTGGRLVLFVVLSTSRWGMRFRRDDGAPATGAALTAREREVVALVAAGRTGPEIADELHIAHDTVRTHVRNAMTKLGARSRAHLVAKALADGVVL